MFTTRVVRGKTSASLSQLTERVSVSRSLLNTSKRDRNFIICNFKSAKGIPESISRVVNFLLSTEKDKSEKR